VRLILDTHALIWYVDQDHLLSRPAHAAITNPGNELFLSAATVWELSIKVGLGKLTLSGPYRPWIEKAISDLRLIQLPVSVEYADAQSRLPHHHGDPFDRLIIAQALTEGVPVVSADAVFDRYGVTRIWA
jgi:PIN domain nuclease of toxin-antitoxin system